jgi:TatD DNase family protein
LELQNKYREFVFSSLGLAPTIMDENEFGRVLELIEQNKDSIIAIGEVGLDFFRIRDDEGQTKQRERFRKFINLAKKFNKPLIVHSRSAGKYAIQVLFEDAPPKVLMHAFDGKVGWVQKGVEAGFYFSIPTSVWHSQQKMKLVVALPVERMLLETDSPVLGPQRGERNEPANIHFAAEKITEIKGIPIKEVEKQTTQNAINFFDLQT